MDDGSALDPQDLLVHASWVRRLAASLVGDDEADDLAQETMRLAIERPPRGITAAGLRAWLGSIVRTRATDVRRNRATRAWHESQASKLEAIEAETTERTELQRRLAQAVHELEEPYKTSVVLRYFDNLPPREIAERLNVSYDAVRQRLSRGLAMLRTKLDRDYGDRQAWSVVCAAVANDLNLASATTALTTGGALVSAKSFVGIAALIAIVATSFWWIEVSAHTSALDARSHATETQIAARISRTPATASPPELDREANSSRRAPVDERRATPTATLEIAQAPAPGSCGVDVIWPGRSNGSTAAFDVLVFNEAATLNSIAQSGASRSRVKSDADGVVRVRQMEPYRYYEIVPVEMDTPQLTQKRGVTLLPNEVRAIEIGAGSEITGVVLDEGETPISGCTVWLVPELDQRARYFTPCEAVAAATITSDQGTFDFTSVGTGSWLVGPGWRCGSDTTCIASSACEADASPIPLTLTIDGARPSVEVVIHVARGLGISGIALDERGEPCKVCCITATDLVTGAFHSVAANAAGRFDLRPLLRGRYAVRLQPSTTGMAGPCAEVTAWTGDTDLRLALTPGKTISVACDAPKTEADAQFTVVLARRSPLSGRLDWAAEASGPPTLHFAALQPGSYQVCATTSDGYFGVLNDVDVPDAGEQREVQITLSPARSSALVVTSSHSLVAIRVSQRDALITSDVVRAGELVPFIALPESVHVEVCSPVDESAVWFAGDYVPGTSDNPTLITLNR